jgi:UPF0271 protein
VNRVLDINCDLGESFGNWRLGDDTALLSRISTANVACGFHGGDPVTMLETVRDAVSLGVAVGAHPGLPDLLGFGRRVMDISPTDAFSYVLYQAGALTAALRASGTQLHHVKPHGALYSMLNEREELAVAVADAMEALMEVPMLYWPSGAQDGALVREAERRGFRIVLEVYVDLGYDDNGRLVLERRKQALDPAVGVQRLNRFLTDGTVPTITGGSFRLEAESLCVHGDGLTAPEVVAAIRAHLDTSGWAVQAVSADAAAAERTLA